MKWLEHIWDSFSQAPWPLLRLAAKILPKGLWNLILVRRQKLSIELLSCTKTNRRILRMKLRLGRKLGNLCANKF
ncbi:unnamed protein product [Caenorhabditis auriculariae]|uniref:Uncharacterized protein n=1 Tax=Caenorhabditis auriculariae TaxID=2777116 RepID=A0A8S1HMZ7_9PELO|nr:unnamed protein product [Caenorhabditis auriculariae]